jgi:hypothetical protein
MTRDVKEAYKSQRHQMERHDDLAAYVNNWMKTTGLGRTNFASRKTCLPAPLMLMENNTKVRETLLSPSGEQLAVRTADNVSILSRTLGVSALLMQV